VDHHAQASIRIILFAMDYVRPNGNIMRAFIPVVRHLAHDCSSWMISAVCQYIKESGDYAILDIDRPYFECDEHGTVLDHLLRSMRTCFKLVAIAMCNHFL